MGSLRESELSERRRRILLAIGRLRKEAEIAPTFVEVGEQVGIVKSHISTELHSLRDLGYVAFEDGKARTLRLTEKGKKEIEHGA